MPACLECVPFTELTEQNSVMIPCATPEVVGAPY